MVKPFTSWPSATISPTYSWPTCMPTGMVLAAQSSHFQIWMSVPQIAVLAILISTSLWPTSGSLTSMSLRPGPASVLTRAFIGWLQLLYRTHRAPYFGKGGDGAVDVFGGMGGAHLGADARLALRHNGEAEADHVDAFFQQRVRHLGRELRLAQHHRDDRVSGA